VHGSRPPERGHPATHLVEAHGRKGVQTRGVKCDRMLGLRCFDNFSQSQQCKGPVPKHQHLPNEARKNSSAVSIGIQIARSRAGKIRCQTIQEGDPSDGGATSVCQMKTPSESRVLPPVTFGPASQATQDLETVVLATHYKVSSVERDVDYYKTPLDHADSELMQFVKGYAARVMKACCGLTLLGAACGAAAARLRLRHQAAAAECRRPPPLRHDAAEPRRLDSIRQRFIYRQRGSFNLMLHKIAWQAVHSRACCICHTTPPGAGRGTQQPWQRCLHAVATLPCALDAIRESTQSRRRTSLSAHPLLLLEPVHGGKPSSNTLNPKPCDSPGTGPARQCCAPPHAARCCPVATADLLTKVQDFVVD